MIQTPRAGGTFPGKGQLGSSFWADQGCAGGGGSQEEPVLAGTAGVCGGDGCAPPVPPEPLLRPEPAAPSPAGQGQPPKPLPGAVPKEPLEFLQPLPARSSPWEGQWSQRCPGGTWAELPAAPGGNHKSWHWGQAPETTPTPLTLEELAAPY